MLLAALDLDWRVEEPVYLRLRWHEAGHYVFHFILKKHPDDRSQLITIRQSPDIERLVWQEGWEVDTYLFDSMTGSQVKPLASNDNPGILH